MQILEHVLKIGKQQKAGDFSQTFRSFSEIMDFRLAVEFSLASEISLA